MFTMCYSNSVPQCIIPVQDGLIVKTKYPTYDRPAVRGNEATYRYSMLLALVPALVLLHSSPHLVPIQF